MILLRSGRNFVLPTVQVIVIGMSIALSVLSLLQITKLASGAKVQSIYNTSLLFITAGFCVALSWFIGCLFRRINTTTHVCFTLLQAITSMHQFVSGIVWICLVVKHLLHSSYTIPIIGVFLVNVVMTSAAITLMITHASEPKLVQALTENDLDCRASIAGSVSTADMENQMGNAKIGALASNKMNANSDSTYLSPIDSMYSRAVTKKLSEQTLVDDQGPAKKFLTGLKRISGVAEEPSEIFEFSHIVDASMKSRAGEAINNFDNWMDSGASKFFSNEVTPSSMTSPVVLGTQSTSRIMSLLRKASYILPISHSKAVPSLFRRSETTPNMTSANFVEVESKFKVFQEQNDHQEVGNDDNTKPRRESLIKTGSDSHISELSKPNAQLQPSFVIREETSGYSTVKLSQTAQVQFLRREERMKSIQDEKVFLLNLNEGLLPSVLKLGESYISELQRKQSFVKVGENDRRNEIDTDEEVDTDIDENNLPYAEEFGVKGETHERQETEIDFDGFTQDSIFLPRSRESKHQESMMFGLEQIPKSTTYQTNEERLNKPYVSINDWYENSGNWNDNRLRVGSSSAGLMISAPSNDELIRKPLRPVYNQLNRSFSAPSLYTFRDNESGPIEDAAVKQLTTSSGLKTADSSGGTTLNSVEPQHLNIITNPSHISQPRTPVNETDTVRTSSSSPIKKFFNESPKRLGSVFKKQQSSYRSRSSLDMDTLGSTTNRHKHSSSVVSNAFSINSSKSGSPKKSLKSIIAKSASGFHNRTNSASMNFFASLNEISKSNSNNNTINVNNYNSSPDIGNRNNIDININNTHKMEIQTSTWHATPKLYSSFPYNPPSATLRTEAIDRWDYDLETTHSSDVSRVSSVPSAVIGKYDQEKWRTLKALERQSSASVLQSHT